jgi:hypothetical protein
VYLLTPNPAIAQSRNEFPVGSQFADLMLHMTVCSNLLLVQSLLVINPVLVAMVFDLVESSRDCVKQTDDLLIF